MHSADPDVLDIPRVTDDHLDAPDGATIRDDDLGFYITRCGPYWRKALPEEVQAALTEPDNPLIVFEPEGFEATPLGLAVKWHEDGEQCSVVYFDQRPTAYVAFDALTFNDADAARAALNARRDS